MKKITTLFCLLLSGAAAFAQTFPTETIVSSGPDSNRIKFVFLADGYLASQQAKFITDVKNVTAQLFGKTPLKEYKSYINVYAVKVPSNAQGAGSSPSSPIDNYFGSTFGVGGTQRCIFASKEALVINVAKSNVPEYAQIFVLVNSTEYGGCGSSDFCTFTANSQAGEVGIHESGHTFAGLADEYWFEFSDAPNQSNISSTTVVKWAKWVGTSSVGVYPYTESPSHYRPHQNCEMRALNQQFCAVCRDVFVSKYHKSVDIVESWLPKNLNLTVNKTDKTNFSVLLLAPTPNTLSVKWTVNGVNVKNKVDNITVDSTLLTQGVNTVIMSVIDSTPFVRVDFFASKITETVKWTVTYGSTTGINIVQSQYYKTGLEIYPNPVQEKFAVNILTNAIREKASLWLVSVDGKRILLQEAIHLSEGENMIDLNIPANTASGIYLLQLEIDGITTAVQSLLKE